MPNIIKFTIVLGIFKKKLIQELSASIQTFLLSNFAIYNIKYKI
jgi:hypothetical protein